MLKKSDYAALLSCKMSFMLLFYSLLQVKKLYNRPSK